MNGMNGGRRSARPPRVALAARLGREIDGAWWPRTSSLAGELPELIEALHRPLGEIVDLEINWSSTEAMPDLDAMSAQRMSLPGWPVRPQHLMAIAGRSACARLLVVPHRTRPALGWMVLRRAAALPILSAQHDTEEFATAGCVLRAAESQSANWTQRMDDLGVVAQPTAQPIAQPL